MDIFLLIPENNKGIIIPDMAIVKEKALTKIPAFSIVTLKVSAIIGSTPTIPISVFNIANIANANINTKILFCFLL